MKKRNSFLVLLVLIGLMMIPKVLFGWLDGWSYKREITLDTATPADSLQVKVELTPSNFTYANAQNEGADLRFTDTDDNLYDYWIEEWSVDDISTIWVDVVTAITDSIYMYYGNSTVNPVSDGDATFLFFDDFENNNFDKWDRHDQDWVIQSDIVKGGIYSADCQVIVYESTTRYLHKDLPNLTDIAIEFDWRINQWVGTGCHKGTLEFSANHDYLDPFLCAPHDQGQSTDYIRYWKRVYPNYRDYPNPKIIELNTWQEFKVLCDFGANHDQHTFFDDFDLGDISLQDTYNVDFTDSDYFTLLNIFGSGGWTTGIDHFYIDNVLIRKYTGSEPIVAIGDEIPQTAVDEPIQGVELTDIILYQNHPNPFNPQTTISYSLPKSGKTELKIYNIKGELVETLLNEEQQAGKHSIGWNAEDVSSGIYLYKIKTAGYVKTKKCVIMK